MRNSLPVFFPDSRFPIPNSRFPIPVPLLGGVRGGFRFPTPDSRFPFYISINRKKNSRRNTIYGYLNDLCQ
ncbi:MULTISPECIES: hypothetical protein [Moorena]|uniref:hypothetical protein n=1 Tax=Moorena TaxID=1155738 RepID=UPI0002FA7D60|nr:MULTISPECIES: hypothetical protein [Moorena]NEP64474.1 hypothetical protein [Moorena sp. SIO3A5]NEQ11618.1 hypothetical protein [Moorena sp. SIO4E2]NER87639.1 hypothetical protein [Moorena sp. SIO3A2]NES45919.1 hypothetical protein [Moorena sp. SIO2C4]